MPYQENEIFANRYKLVKKLGVGGFSEVWLADDELTDGNQIALKIYAPNGGLDNQGLKVFSKEYALLQDINNQYLLKAMHFDINNDMPYLILPYCPHGSLLGQLHDKGNFTEEELAKVIFEVCTGLSYLHDNGIIHQDIKPANILINRRQEYVISDFGISNNVRRTLRKSMGVASTSMSPEYAPPERFSSNPKTVPAGDVFSFGVLLYEMATGDVPWMGMGGMSLSRGAEIPSMPEGFSNNFKKWCTACLAVNPDDRPDAGDLAKAAHTFMTENYWPPYKGKASAAKPKPKASARKTVAKVDLDEMAQQIDENLKAESATANKKAKGGAATMKDGTPQKSQTNKKKKSPVLAIILAVIVLAGGGYGVFWFMEKQKQDKFDALMAEASTLALDSNWIEASVAYQEAQELMPEDTSATNGLKRMTVEMENIVSGVIAEAEKLAESEHYNDALKVLDKANEYESQFAEIDEARNKYNDLIAKQKEEQFEKYMALGDKYLKALTYAKAAEYFGRADEVKPGDPRVQEKLNSIGSKLKALYAGEISKGDAFMSNKQHSDAVSAYGRAILYDKSNAEGKTKLAKAKAAVENDLKLWQASRDGNSSSVSSLIAAGANVNYVYDYKSCFNQAVYGGNETVAKALKNAGASCDLTSELYYFGSYYNLPEYAAKSGDLEMLKFLKSDCYASLDGLYEITSYTNIKDYLKSLGYGKTEYLEYFSSSSSSSFSDKRDVNREWSFRDGKMFVRCLTELYSGWNTADFDEIDINADWELSLDITHVSGNTGEGGYGIVFAADDDHLNIFGVTQEGSYHLGYYSSAWETDYVKSSSINTGSTTNTLKIKKTGNTLYYYINDKYITSKYGVTMAGTEFGMYYGASEGYTTLWFDNFKLSQL
ncbi:MAG: protein kinase [Bacteroidia bacterium]